MPGGFTPINETMLTDPYLIIYTLGGLVLVLLTFAVLSIFTEAVRSMNQKVKDEEKKKKEAEREKLRRAG